LAALSWLQKNQVDEARSSEVILNQIAVRTREINNLTLTVLREQKLTPEADVKMRGQDTHFPRQCLRHTFTPITPVPWT